MKNAIRKALSILLVTVMLVSSAPLAGFVGLDLPGWLDFGKLFAVKTEAATYGGTCGENLTWTLDTSTGELVISGTGSMNSYSSSTAPWYSYRSYIKTVKIGNAVTSIGDRAFYECTSLTSITIPDSVTSIGDIAFYECTSLTSITISDSITSIGNGAFYSCESLTSITIPDSVTSIGYHAFAARCNKLTNITVDSKNTVYSSDKYGVLFNKDKTELIQYPIGNTRTSYQIPAGVTSVEGEAFSYCESLISVTIPDSVISIGDLAFYFCDSLTSVTIPNSVISIGDLAFSLCDSLTSITVGSANTAYSSDKYGVLFNKDKTELIQYPIGNTRTSYQIPDGVTSIGNDAFHGGDCLTSIMIPDSVTSIGKCSFGRCDNLANVTLPDSVTSIGDSAFYSCDSLTSITIPDSVTSIGDWAFWYCGSLSDVYYSGTEAEWNAISIGSYNEDLTTATIHFKDDTCCTVDWKMNCDHEFINGYLTIDEGENIRYECSLKYNLCENARVEQSFDGAPCFASCQIFNENGEPEPFFSSISINGLSGDPLVSGFEYKYILDIPTDRLAAGKYKIKFYIPGMECDFHEIYYDVMSTVQLEVVDAECCGLEIIDADNDYEMYNGYLMVPVGEPITEEFNLIFDTCPHGYVESDSDGAVYVSYTVTELISEEIRVVGFGIVNSDGLKEIESGKVYNMDFWGITESLEPGEYKLRVDYPAVGCELHGFGQSAASFTNIKIVENATLSFDANGGSGAPQAMSDAVYYTLPSAVPVRDGYIFVGWSPSMNGNEVFTAGDRYGIFRGTTLYAIWEFDSEFVSEPTVSEIKYGDSIVLHADIPEVPEGGYILWTASNGNFDYTVSADGTTCTITPSKSGDTVFTATVYDAEGNEVCKDEQTMTSKAGFFQKLAAFFRKLFGLTKVYPQEIK